jgi:predicted transcriptional regulator
MTKSDDAILMLLDKSSIVLSPKVIAYNTDLSKQTVYRRIRILLENELVVKVDKGMYEISPKGHAYLKGEIDAEDLEE